MLRSRFFAILGSATVWTLAPMAVAQTQQKKRILIIVSWGEGGAYEYRSIKSPWSPGDWFSPITDRLNLGLDYKLIEKSKNEFSVKVKIFKFVDSKPVVLGHIEADVDELRFRMSEKSFGDLTLRVVMVYD